MREFILSVLPVILVLVGVALYSVSRNWGVLAFYVVLALLSTELSKEKNSGGG